MTVINYYPINREPEAAEAEWNAYLISEGWVQVKSGRFFKASNEAGHRFIANEFFHYTNNYSEVESITAEY